MEIVWLCWVLFARVVVGRHVDSNRKGRGRGDTMTCKTDFESAIYVLERKEAHRNEGSNRYMVGGGGKKEFSEREC